MSHQRIGQWNQLEQKYDYLVDTKFRSEKELTSSIMLNLPALTPPPVPVATVVPTAGPVKAKIYKE